MKRKLIGTIGFAGLSIVLLVLYFSINGNPYTKYKARESVKDYLKQTYPEMKDFELSHGGHDWYSGSYDFDVTKQDSYGNKETFGIDTNGHAPYDVVLDTRAEILTDMDKSDEFTEQATTYVLKELKTQGVKVTEDENNILYVNVDKKNTDKKWSPNIQTFGAVSGSFKLNNSLSKKDFEAETKKVQRILAELGIDYDKVSIYNDNYDYYITPQKLVKL